MEPALILVGLIVASLPFVLPIVSLVRQSRLRHRLVALEDALDAQKHTIDDLTRRLTQLKRDTVAPAAPIAAPSVAPAARELVMPPAPPPIPRPAAPQPVTPPAPSSCCSA